MTNYKVTGTEKPLTILFFFFTKCDIVSFEKTIKYSKWRNAMDNEIAVAERNNTWDLVELPKGQKSIRVK